MDSIKIEIYHGGEFKTNEGIYYYSGGKVETIYNVQIDALSVQRFENFCTLDIGYSHDIKIYCKNPKITSKDGYILLWNDQSIDEISEYAKKFGYIEVFVDHSGEKKTMDVVEDGMNIKEGGLNDSESENDPDYEDDSDEESESDVPSSEGDEDDELEKIRQRKQMVINGKINPLRDGILTDMVIDDGFEEDKSKDEPRQEKEFNYDSYMGEIPIFNHQMQYESEAITNMQIQFEENTELGCDKIDKNFEEDDNSDSFNIPSPISTDSSDNEEEMAIQEQNVTQEKKKKRHPQYPTFNPNISLEHIDFEPGLLFTSRDQLKEAIINYGVAKQRRVWIKRNDFQRIQAKCRDGCKWELWASRVKDDESFQVKTYKKEHNCIIVSKQRIVKAEWLAKKFGSTIRSNPRWKLKEFAEAINAKYKIHCTLNQCWWAKKLAMAELESVLNEHYGRLWDYGAEILRTNPGSSVYIKGEVSEDCPQPTFQRIYVCFSALRKGFTEGCRNIIGLDGCFLKGYIKGELLTAIGRDGNNQMFPIAWAVVEVECTDSWIWFIKLLKDDLNLGDGYNYTLITDQQKGLKNAIDEHLPAAEHRCCARHIYANWRKNHPGHALKCAFWRAAKSTTVAEFNISLDEIRRMPGRPKKHRRREAEEEGTRTKLSKKGIVMKCSRCLMIGHNKATCETDEAEVVENHRKADEAKKAQSEAAKAHSLRNKQNVRNKTQVNNTIGQPSSESVQPKERGRLKEMILDAKLELC